MTLDRRDLLKRAAGGLVLAQMASGLSWTTPARAAAAQAPLRTLSATEGWIIAGLGDVLAPGAATLGLAHYLDHHLSVAPAESLLMLRYLDVLPPYIGFYRAGLAATEALRARLLGVPLEAMTAADWQRLLQAMLAPDLAGWQGPPAGLFYFALRGDAVDVVYGTRAGFERLGVDYLAHIEPETDW